jgi:hypothetical protein
MVEGNWGKRGPMNDDRREEVEEKVVEEEEDWVDIGQEKVLSSNTMLIGMQCPPLKGQGV